MSGMALALLVSVETDSDEFINVDLNFQTL